MNEGKREREYTQTLTVCLFVDGIVAFLFTFAPFLPTPTTLFSGLLEEFHACVQQRKKKNRIQNDNVETGYQKLKNQVKTVSEHKLLKLVRSSVLVNGPQN